MSRNWSRIGARAKATARGKVRDEGRDVRFLGSIATSTRYASTHDELANSWSSARMGKLRRSGTCDSEACASHAAVWVRVRKHALQAGTARSSQSGSRSMQGVSTARKVLPALRRVFQGLGGGGGGGGGGGVGEPVAGRALGFVWSRGKGFGCRRLRRVPTARAVSSLSQAMTRTRNQAYLPFP